MSVIGSPFGNVRSRAWLLATLGLLSAIAAVLFVLAPVNQAITTYEWPSGQASQSTALPLMPYQPERMDVTVDCAQMDVTGAGHNEAGATILATTPPEGLRGEQPSEPGMTMRLQNGDVAVQVADTPVTSAPMTGGCAWRIHSDAGGTTVSLDGTQLAHTAERPSVNGLFTDLAGPSNAAALHASVTADTRFETSPSALKIACAAVSVLSLLGMLVVLHAADRRYGRNVRLVPRGWLRPRLSDLAVTVVLAVWAVIGALTVDDGYIISMLKDSANTDFMGNYMRWFNAPEAPFGWFYELYAPLAQLSASGVWMRLPSVLLGLGSWALIDRALLPRLTSGSRRWTTWACAALFLAWYLPFNVGLRPEPWVVFGSLVVFVLVERALATRTIGPLAIAVIIAGATVAITPTGLVALLPLVAGLGAILRLLRRRRDVSWPALLGVVLASASSTLLVMFYDQTLPAVLEATSARTQIGPANDWQEEIGRYTTLLNPDVVEGSLNRRLPVLLTLVCMAVLGALLINKRIPGLVGSATRRLVVASALYLVALTFTPTKWTHHFGALAGFGAVLIAVLVHTIARGALRSVWARSVSLALFSGAVALGVSAPNSWWYVSGLDVKWADTAPVIRGVPISAIVLGLGLAVAGVGGVVGAWRAAGGRPSDERSMRWLPSSGWLLAAVAVCAVVVEVGTMAYAVKLRWDTYSIGKANLAAFGGHSCGIEDWVGVEPDIGAGVLPPVPETAPAEITGMRTNAGYPPDSRPAAPYGMDAAHPVWGSYGAPEAASSLRSGWYQLPAHASAPDAAPLVVQTAGTGEVQAAVEFADSNGQVVQHVELAADTGEVWQDTRLDPAQAPGADRVRILAEDTDAEDGWVGVSAPRQPELVASTDLVPPHEPVAMDWPNAFVLPCREPASLAGGLTQPVRYRFAPGPDSRDLAGVSYTAGAGGPYAPLTALATERTVPTYLRGDKLREPISVLRFEYPTPMRDVRVASHSRSVSGLASNPPLLRE